jgi:hypothetical protein
LRFPLASRWRIGTITVRVAVSSKKTIAFTGEAFAWVAGDEEADDEKWGARNGVCGPKFAIENNTVGLESLIYIVGRFLCFR